MRKRDCNVTIASVRLMHRWRHNSSTATYFLKLYRCPGVVSERNVKLSQLIDRNHINDWCAEYQNPKFHGTNYEWSTRLLGFIRESGYFSQLSYRYFHRIIYVPTRLKYCFIFVEYPSTILFHKHSLDYFYQKDMSMKGNLHMYTIIRYGFIYHQIL